ncbi:hypothetical protein C8R44DRAFT_745495 [Mycena epipterygia]|nr:hypothetical protein C8R44DRAFT_745495 [Mycena epipterygia]
MKKTSETPGFLSTSCRKLRDYIPCPEPTKRADGFGWWKRGSDVGWAFLYGDGVESAVWTLRSCETSGILIETRPGDRWAECEEKGQFYIRVTPAERPIHVTRWTWKRKEKRNTATDDRPSDQMSPLPLATTSLPSSNLIQTTLHRYPIAPVIPNRQRVNPSSLFVTTIVLERSAPVVRPSDAPSADHSPRREPFRRCHVPFIIPATQNYYCALRPTPHP